MNEIKILIQAAQVREQYDLYCLNADEVPKSVDDYLHVISEYSEHEIFTHDVPWDSKRIRGTMLREEGVGNIYFAERIGTDPDHPERGITECEQRFIAIKEAAHLVIDDDDSYTELVLKLVDDLVMNTEKSLEKYPESSQSEWWAIVFAMELLFPWEDRQAHLEAVIAGSSTFYDVAKKYMIPERQVIWILSANAHPALQEIHERLLEIEELEKDQ